MGKDRGLSELIAAIGPGRLALATGHPVRVHELWDQAVAHAAVNEKNCWQPGDRVIVSGVRGYETLLAVLAIWQRGAVPVLGARVEDEQDWPGTTTAWRYPDGTIIRDGIQHADAPAPAVIHASSGTTRRPKLAQRSFESLLAEADRYVERYALAAEQNACVVAPIEHSFAFGALLGILAAGGNARLVPVFHPRALARDLLTADLDVVVLTPTMARLALDAAGEEKPRRTKPPLHVIAGAGVVPDALDAAFKAKFGCGLARNYGCSETGATFGAPHSLPQGCLGQPFEGVVVKSPRIGAEADELVIDIGHAVLGLEGGVQPADHKDGTWRTGDLAERREDGAVMLLGRLDDQVKINGHLVDGWQLAARARAVEEVKDAVVLALPRSGRAEIQDLILICEAGHTPSVAIAQQVQSALPDTPVKVVMVDEFPRTAAGKPDRQALERLAREQLARMANGDNVA